MKISNTPPVDQFTYYPSQGYGWGAAMSDPNTWDRGPVAGSTALTRDDEYGTQLTFQVNLPDGSYDVTPTLGDVIGAHSAEVFLQGTLIDTVTTAYGQIDTPTYLATVTDGVLTLGLTGEGAGGYDGYAVIGGLAIAPAQGQEESQMLAAPAGSSIQSAPASPQPSAASVAGGLDRSTVLQAMATAAEDPLAPFDLPTQKRPMALGRVPEVSGHESSGSSPTSRPIAPVVRPFFELMPRSPRPTQGIPSRMKSASMWRWWSASE